MIIFENVLKKNNKLTQIPVLLKGQMNTIGMPTEDEKEAAFFFYKYDTICTLSYKFHQCTHFKESPVYFVSEKTCY